jgi:hypothetical protein
LIRGEKEHARGGGVEDAVGVEDGLGSAGTVVEVLDVMGAEDSAPAGGVEGVERDAEQRRQLVSGQPGGRDFDRAGESSQQRVVDEDILGGEFFGGVVEIDGVGFESGVAGADADAGCAGVAIEGWQAPAGQARGKLAGIALEERADAIPGVQESGLDVVMHSLLIVR